METLPSDHLPGTSPEDAPAETISLPPLEAPIEPTLYVEPLEDRVLLASDVSPTALGAELAASEPTGPALIGPAVPGMTQDLSTIVHNSPAAGEAIADITAEQHADTSPAASSDKANSAISTKTSEQHAEPIEQLTEVDEKAEPEQEKLEGDLEAEDPIATIEPEAGSRQKSTDYERLVAEGASALTKLEVSGVIDQITADVAQQAALQ